MVGGRRSVGRAWGRKALPFVLLFENISQYQGGAGGGGRLTIRRERNAALRCGDTYMIISFPRVDTTILQLQQLPVYLRPCSRVFRSICSFGCQRSDIAP